MKNPSVKLKDHPCLLGKRSLIKPYRFSASTTYAELLNEQNL